MKKIGVLTFHRSYSYGACLQAYGTVAFLNENGYSAEIIDYTNAYEQRFRKPFFTENGSISGYVSSLIKDIVLRKRHYSKMAFDEHNNYYPISSRSYVDHTGLSEVDYDVLIVGSDQVWNRDICNGLDDAFLLRYGNAQRRISIASSMGSVRLTDEEKKKFKLAFEDFSAISAREEYAKVQLQPLTEKPIKVLMDPTFLFTKKEWEQRMVLHSEKYGNVREKYILTFFLSADASYRKIVAEYAEILKIPVWSIQSTRVKRVNSDRVILGASIEDFVALISNAELIITDSFHGAALSINLKKNFVPIKNANNPLRVIALLDELGIPERMNMKADEYHPVDYEKVDAILEPLRNDSQKWIIDAVEGYANG